MKRVVDNWILGIAAALVMCAHGSTPAVAQEQDFTVLAKRIVNTSANVKPGEVVVVSGGKHTIPLMEAITIEVAKAGGMATMFLSSDRVERALLTEVPEDYLGQHRQFLREWIKQVDVWIGLPGFEDRTATREGVPESRIAKMRQGGQVVWNALNDMKERVVWVLYPSRAAAQTDGIDFSKLEQMHWASLNADYDEIAQSGKKLQRLMKNARQLRITSPAGTDFTVAMGGRTVFVNDGTVSAEEPKNDLFRSRFVTLPGGSIQFAPLEDSANGRVSVPKHGTRLGPLNGIEFAFKSGKMLNFTAKEGTEGFEEIMATRQGAKDVIGTISIGLNPAAHILEGPEATIYPGYAAGMVWVNVGNNQLFGGKNTEPGRFGFPVRDATVSIDGKVVVQNGKLKL